MFSGPGVHYPHRVDAQKDALRGRVVRSYVQEGIHSALGVWFGIRTHSIDYSAGACGCRHFSAAQYIQGEGVVGLVACPVADRGSFRYAEEPFGLRTCKSLDSD